MKLLVFLFALLLSRPTIAQEDDDDTTFVNREYDEEPHQQQQQQQAVITPTSWVVSATTHMPKQLPHALAKDFTKQTNYIHWACYRKEAPLPTDKLQCCREIYQVQEKDPFHLCWRKRGCLRDKVGRSDFMHYCTEMIVTLANLAASDQSLQPRFSLLVAPQLADLPSDQWRQFVAFDSTQGGHWVYNIESPFRLSMDPNQFLTAGDDAEVSNESGSFDAVLSSSVLPDPGDAEDFRDLKQKLVVSFPSDDDEAGNANGNDEWAVKAEILLYLPEPAGLRKTKAKPKCKSSAGDCTLETIDDTDDPLDQQYLIKTVVSLPKVASTSTTTVEWTYSIALDDDNIILPAPFIYAASASSLTDETKVLKWKPTAMEKVALPTSLEDRDEL